MNKYKLVIIIYTVLIIASIVLIDKLVLGLWGDKHDKWL